VKKIFSHINRLKYTSSVISGFFYLYFAVQNPAHAFDSDLKVNALDGPMPSFRLAVEAARTRGDTQIIVQLENISIQDDPELLELVIREIRELLLRNNFGDGDTTIIECPKKCNAPPEPVEPDLVDNGTTVTLQVNALDGPMPPFLVAVDQAKNDNVYRVIVHLENVGGVDDLEIIELEILEINEILDRYGYTKIRRDIIQCSLEC
jgi:translation elongation factor EF-Tu-like GTPase